HLRGASTESLLLVCGGTFERAAYEDVLCAGAVLERLAIDEMTDAALLALTAYGIAATDLLGALQQAENGRRLRARPQLADDVPFCATVDRFHIAAALDRDGTIRRIG
ncbi:MAG TPA: 2-phosphosulfolactate phosphatase, partial [Chthoniobacterales bacterium]